MDEPAETPAARHLKALIATTGPVPVAELFRLSADFYYTGEKVFGREGDFVTSSGISQIFGELVGLWAADWWQRAGKGPCWLVEAGPGNGTMMQDALRAISRALPAFRDALRLCLVENSPRRRREQMLALADADPLHVASLGDIPKGRAVILANEFLDAFPVSQFLRTKDGYCERMVGIGPAGELCFCPGPELPPEFRNILTPVQQHVPPGSVIELSPARENQFRLAAQHLERWGGCLLLADYGSDGTGDTLQALRRHERVSPLARPGEADLTARVDFERLLRIAAAGKVNWSGPVAQGAFLDRLGGRTRAAALAAACPARSTEIRAGYARLADREQMGELFRVMALYAPPGCVPAGFG